MTDIEFFEPTPAELRALGSDAVVPGATRFSTFEYESNSNYSIVVAVNDHTVFLRVDVDHYRDTHSFSLMHGDIDLSWVHIEETTTDCIRVHPERDGWSAP